MNEEFAKEQIKKLKKKRKEKQYTKKQKSNELERDIIRIEKRIMAYDGFVDKKEKKNKF